jgi:signal transduction histidine kinase
VERAVECRRLLILAGLESDAERLRRELGAAGRRFVTQRVSSLDGFLDALDHFEPDAILADFELPQFSALGALDVLAEREARIPFILVTATPVGENAIACMRAGADDCIPMTSLERLPAALENVMAKREAECQRENQLLHTLRALQRTHDELQTAQLQLIQAAKMESVGRLAAGVAHQVRNPLTVLAMGIEYVRRHAPADAESTTDVLDQMDDAIGRASSVIHQLADFSAPDVLRRSTVQLDAVIDRALAFLRHEIVARNVTLERRTADHLPLVSLDGNKIEQVFVNVCLNALDAMDQGGVLRLETALESGDGATAAAAGATTPRIVVRVSDTGPGIRPEHLPRVFDPFFTTKPTGKGTGLGLPVIRRIVEIHGGSIAIRNRAPAGAEVTIVLPVDVAAGA